MAANPKHGYSLLEREIDLAVNQGVVIALVEISLTTETDKCNTKDCILKEVNQLQSKMLVDQSWVSNLQCLMNMNGSKFKCSKTNDLNTIYYIFCFNDD